MSPAAKLNKMIDFEKMGKKEEGIVEDDRLRSLIINKKPGANLIDMIHF